MTTPHDIAIQILCWLFNGKQSEARFASKGSMWVGLSSDDLADAYHGVPNLPSQLNLCVVAIRSLHSGLTEFYISKTHLFGLAAAVVHFHRLPELMTAICRRIGQAPSWHFFDDQGTLDFEAQNPTDRFDDLPGMSAFTFVDIIYSKVGRPFKPSKHLAPDSTQIHLGLSNMLGLFHENTVSLSPKPGKLEALHSSLLEIRTRQYQKATLGEIMVLAGKLIFLLMSCFNKMARGGLQPFFPMVIGPLRALKHHEQ